MNYLLRLNVCCIFNWNIRTSCQENRYQTQGPKDSQSVRRGHGMGDPFCWERSLPLSGKDMAFSPAIIEL